MLPELSFDIIDENQVTLGPQSFHGILRIELVQARRKMNTESTVFSARNGRRLSRTPIVVMLGLSMLLVFSIGYLSFLDGQAHDAATEQSSISGQIEKETDELFSLLKDAETGQRGFLLTGRDSYLGPYKEALIRVPEAIRRLETATRLRPDQSDRLRLLRPVVEDKLRELAKSIQIRREKGLDASRQIVETDQGEKLMESIRSISFEIQDVARRRVAEFAVLAEASEARLRAVSTIGSLILLGFSVLLALTVFRGLRQRERLYYEASISAEHFRVTLLSIGDAVIATDERGTITFINPVALKLTAWTEVEALGTPIWSVFPIVNETTRAKVDNPIEKALATGQIVGLANHTVLMARDGREIPIDDAGAPIRTREGAIVGAILVFRDISVRRTAERNLLTANVQLKEFVDGAAHDLKAPLRSIAIFTRVLQRRSGEQLDEEGKNAVAFIIRSVQRMDSLLNDLVNYARASHFELGPGQASMDSALRTALANLQADIEASNAVVTAGELPVLPVHELHLVQLLQNLIGNAVKYRSEDAPRIGVTCNKNESDWVVQVSDNGLGIGAEYVDVIFKPFKRLHGEDRPGNGIGLATCEKILGVYGGRIWVESTPGEGSTFCFTIPIGESPADTAEGESVLERDQA